MGYKIANEELNKKANEILTALCIVTRRKTERIRRYVWRHQEGR